ncbi:MAG: sn-glycerol-1-phosphate dehydrogenase [Anaerolineae bacterium]
MKTKIPVYYQENIIPELVAYCENNHLRAFCLVADQNTYLALGKAVEEALVARGLDVKTILLEGKEVVNDEYYLVQVLIQVSPDDKVFLSVGSGTITDIVRLISHRIGASFIALPTAPSVDGYSSGGAPTVIGGVKQTIYAQPPRAIFADLNTLCAAPRPMIAAGFGDMLGKYTSLADWELGHLVWDEPYSPEIAQRVRDALGDCVAHVGEIASGSAGGIRSLMDALTESGLCMLEFGASPPASGSEHYLSHFLELKLLRENRPAILHGAKVGAACILVAAYYQQLGDLTRKQAEERLERTPMPDRESEIQRIRAAYPAIAGQIIAEQTPFLDMSPQAYSQLKYRIIEHWDQIRAIAATVPPPQDLAALLRQLDGPTDMRALGLGDEEVAQALEYAHYYRNRFTAIKLSRMLGIQPFASQSPTS